VRNYDTQRQREQGRSMTRRGGDQGDWQGYVQPYEYYGPGYRGVGYYAVFYQGPGASGNDQSDTDESQTQFDQRNVHDGQGQGAGAAWDRGRRGSWGWNQPSGASGDRARQVGQFAGRGPKGYQRSDERIREDVSDRLMEHPEIDASDVEVKVKNRVVTLTGTVDDRYAKRLAEDIAETVMGVSDVMNQLGVEGQTGRSRSETTGTRGTTETTASSEPRNGRRPAATTSR
jgi:osmotically-inducible protein OsmY